MLATAEADVSRAAQKQDTREEDSASDFPRGKDAFTITGIRMKEEPEEAPVHAAFGGLTGEMQERVTSDIRGPGRIRQRRGMPSVLRCRQMAQKLTLIERTLSTQVAGRANLPDGSLPVTHRHPAARPVQLMMESR